VRWSKALSSPDGNLEVSFPNIRYAITCPITAYHFGSQVSVVGLPYEQRRDGQPYNTMPFCAPPSLFSRLILIQNNHYQMFPIS